MSENAVPNKEQIRNLTIYSSNEKSVLTVEAEESKLLFKGAGKYGVSFFQKGLSTTNYLTNEIKNLKSYAISTEGRVKLSAIAICTSTFGVYGLITTKTRFKRIGYLLGGFGLSSAVCYPRQSYNVAKVSAIKGYQFSQTGWAHSKYGFELFYNKYLASPEEEPEEVLLGEEGADNSSKDIAKPMNVPNVFEEPSLSITSNTLLEVKGNHINKTADASDEASGIKEPQITKIELLPNNESTKDGTNIDVEVKPGEEKDEYESKINCDVGQSVPSDKELYSTRTS